MIRISSASGTGWLAYVGPPGPDSYAVCGDVLWTELSARGTAYGGNEFQLSCTLAPGGHLLSGQQAGRSQEELLWDALQRWPRPAPGTRNWPPELAAMIELANRHPEEYRELRGNPVPLHVVPDPWLAPGGLSWKDQPVAVSGAGS